MAMQSLTEVTNNRNQTMSSREIAELTVKRHDHVLRDIDNILKTLSPELGLGFKSTTYKDSTGRENRMYLLDRDSSVCLVTGYDANARMRIIKRWQELEAQQVPRIPQTYAEALQLAADQAKQLEQQSRELEAAKPMIEFHEEVSKSETEYTVPKVAKILFNGSVKETGLREWLKTNGWMDRRKGFNEPTMWAIRQQYMRLRLREEVSKGRFADVPVITSKGFVLLRHLYRTGDLFLSSMDQVRCFPQPEYCV